MFHIYCDKKTCVMESSKLMEDLINYMDNIILGRDISEQDAKKAAACAQISEFIMSTDYGYDSIAGDCFPLININYY